MFPPRNRFNRGSQGFPKRARHFRIRPLAPFRARRLTEGDLSYRWQVAVQTLANKRVNRHPTLTPDRQGNRVNDSTLQ